MSTHWFWTVNGKTADEKTVFLPPDQQAQYVNLGQKQLRLTQQAMQAAGLSLNKGATTLPDGTSIVTMAGPGFSKVLIDVKRPPKPEPEEAQDEPMPVSTETTEEKPTQKRHIVEYCTFEPSREIYSYMPFEWISAPVMDSKKNHIYVAFLRDSFSSDLYEVETLDGMTLKTSGSIDIGYIALSRPGRIDLLVDTKSDTFILFTRGYKDQNYDVYPDHHNFIWKAGHTTAAYFYLGYGNYTDYTYAASDMAVNGKLVVGINMERASGVVYNLRIFEFESLALLYTENLDVQKSLFLSRAYVMPNGDVILQNNRNWMINFGKNNVTYDVTGASFHNTSAPAITNNANFIIGTNGGKLWQLNLLGNATRVSESPGWGLSRQNDGGWEPVNVRGGIYFGGSNRMYFPSLLHDPVTDAVALVQGDLSGIHIFNAKDCMGNPIPDFFYQISNAPTRVAEANNARQFHDGTLLILMGESRNYWVCRIDIGILQQRKVTETYEDGALVSSVTQ